MELNYGSSLPLPKASSSKQAANENDQSKLLETKAFEELNAKVYDRLDFKEDYVQNELEARVVIAEEWLRNKRVFTDKAEFFQKFYYDIMHFCKKISKENFMAYYRNDRLSARRNELVMRGIDVHKAEKFLKWACISDLPYGFEFEPFDVTVLGKLPHFTIEMDNALLGAISTQEALFMDNDFIDWTVVKGSHAKLSNLHEEQLKWRFEKFRGKPEILVWFFDDDDLIEQKALCEFRTKHGYKGRSYELIPVRKAVKYIQNASEFDSKDYLYWINLATELEQSDNVLDLKKKIWWYAHTLRRTACDELFLISKKLDPNEKGTDEIVESFGDQYVKLAEFIMDIWINQKDPDFQNDSGEFSVEVCQKMYDTTRESFFRVFPLIQKAKVKGPLSYHDAFVFQYIKKWELFRPTEEVRPVYNHFQTLVFQSQQKPKRVLSDTDITSMFQNDDAENSDTTFWNNDEVSDGPSPFQNLSNFSKRFCWRKISNDEWLQMIMVICKCELVKKLDANVTWRFIIKKSKVIIGKSPELVKEEFFADVLPKIENYVSDEEVVRYFRQ